MWMRSKLICAFYILLRPYSIVTPVDSRSRLVTSVGGAPVGILPRCLNRDGYIIRILHVLLSGGKRGI